MASVSPGPLEASAELGTDLAGPVAVAYTGGTANADLRTGGDAAYRRAMMEMSRRGWRRDEPASLGKPEQPELLGRATALLGEKRQFKLDDLSLELALGPEGLAPYEDLLHPIEPLAV